MLGAVLFAFVIATLAVVVFFLASLAFGYFDPSPPKARTAGQVPEIGAVDVTPMPAPAPEREPECDMRWN